MHSTYGIMNGYAIWTIIGVLLAIFLVVSIGKMMRKK